MTLLCPICKSPAQEIARTRDATGFHCPTHGDFKVADTVFAEDGAEDYTREEWEAGLDKAKQRMEPEEEEEKWHLIITDDFY
jgi:predicted RNA-binding Zn-ribbon protein involved in translation (DUF1610 family)